MIKTYIITFDPQKTDSSALHKVIKESNKINGWWHWLSSTYLVNSEFTLSTIHQEIIDKWPSQRFLIMEVNTDNRNGWLPEKAYEWIKNNGR